MNYATSASCTIESEIHVSKINGAVFGDTALDLVNLPSVTC